MSPFQRRRNRLAGAPGPAAFSRLTVVPLVLLPLVQKVWPEARLRTVPADESAGEGVPPDTGSRAHGRGAERRIPRRLQLLAGIEDVKLPLVHVLVPLVD